MKTPGEIFGVDFSGAKLAGRNIWIARADVSGDRLRLLELHNLESLAKTADRAPALAYLVEMIRQSNDSLWGMDFPFGLPVELFDDQADWQTQLNHVAEWKQQAHELGLWCVTRARTQGDKMHIRRTTDSETKTPFDCYHYRIIYQTFHGMRDVMLPLSTDRQTAILPFQYSKLSTAKRIVTESCPGSVLKRLKLPHQNYKQPAGGPLTLKRRRTRTTILAGIEPFIDIPPLLRRRMIRNPGGDAIDAVIAAVGAHQTWTTADHRHIREHPRYRHEGYVFS